MSPARPRIAAAQPALVPLDSIKGRGTATADIWTCDFTKDYVQINADYRS